MNKNLLTHKIVEKYILSMPSSRLDYPFGEGVAVYRISKKQKAKSKKLEDKGSMFALIQEGKDPIQLSLKCDPKLAEVLRAKYDSILPGYHLNKKHWNTVLITGQVPWEEVKDLIRHSYELVAKG